MKKLKSIVDCSQWRLNFNTDIPSVIWLLSNMFSVRYVIYTDRFNIFKDSDYYWNHYAYNESLDDIKSLPNMSFEKCCNKRTNELIDLSNKLDKDIYVSWSGGVDSTCIISSFLMNDRLDKSRFHVIYNDYSIAEYTLFYLKGLQNKGIHLHNCISNLCLIEEIPKDNFVINGCCGDKMEPASTIDLLKYFKFPVDTPWEDVIIKICNNLNFKDTDYYIDAFNRYIKAFDLRVKTFPELAWILEFGCEWRRTTNFRKLYSKYPESRIVYYDTPYFSKFALDRYLETENGCCFTGNNYKREFKKIIYKYIQDEDYFLYKGKDVHPWSQNHKPILYYSDDLGQHIAHVETSKRYYNTLIPYMKDEIKEYVTVSKRTY